MTLDKNYTFSASSKSDCLTLFCLPSFLSQVKLSFLSDFSCPEHRRALAFILPLPVLLSLESASVRQNNSFFFLLMSSHPSLLFSFLFFPHLLHPIASNAQKQNLENLTPDWESEGCCMTNLGWVVWFPLCFGDYNTWTPLWNTFAWSKWKRLHLCSPYPFFQG